MQLVLLLFLAAGALAYLPPSHWPQLQTTDQIDEPFGKVPTTRKPDNNLGLAIENDPTANWKKDLKILLGYGLNWQLYNDAQKVLDDVAKFLSNLDRIPENEVATSNYDTSILPEDMIAYFKKLEKYGLPKETLNELTRVATEIMKYIKWLKGLGSDNAKVSSDSEGSSAVIECQKKYKEEMSLCGLLDIVCMSTAKLNRVKCLTS